VRPHHPRRGRATAETERRTDSLICAAVDVGANSVHLLVGSVDGHRVEPLRDDSVLLGLGTDVDARGLIPAETRDRLVTTLAEYAAAARELGAARIAFVGTEPLRRAADARAMVVAVEAATGIPFHVLDHQEEGLLTLLGATSGRAVEADLLVVDVGGGSTQLVLVGPSRRATATGLRVGGARLTQAHVAHDPPTEEEVALLRAAAVEALRNGPDGAPTRILAVGGTGSNLAKVIPGALDDRILTPERLTAALKTLQAAPADVIATRFGIRPERARILAGGTAILEAIMARYGLRRVTVSEEGIREGLVLALARAGGGWRDRLDALAHGWGGDAAISAD
jgi:exopolyphosphatase/guanosine-5'-triphosphate,3'-diphosphate pyrophosphatase